MRKNVIITHEVIVMKKKAIILWILVLLWMIVIFSFSNADGYNSTSKSKEVTYKIVDTIEKKKTELEKKAKVEKLHPRVRKIAHAIEYAILCILLILALEATNISNNRVYLTALLTCIVYALTDEVHQLFISGRTGELKDIIIDTAGATIGLLIYDFIYKMKEALKNTD